MPSRIAMLILAGAVLAGCARQESAPPLSEADASAIRAATDAYSAAVRDTAWSDWADHYTDDAVILPPNEPAVRGRENMLQWVRAFPPITSFTLTPVEVEGHGDLAYVYGNYEWVVILPGGVATPDAGKYVEIWRKQADGSWKISRDIFNSDVAMAAAGP